MGAYHFSLDPALASLFAEHCGLRNFVETGTFRGDTLASLLGTFRQLYSVELSPELAGDARRRFAGEERVHLFCGDAAECLRDVRTALEGAPALYWLDAHWCVADGTAGEKSQCPLLEELAALDPLHQEDVVLIDDARLFLAPPPAPHETSDWPGFQQILENFARIRKDHHLMVLNDVIVIFPARLSEVVNAFAREHGEDLSEVTRKAREREELALQKEELAAAHSRAAEFGESMRREYDNLLRRVRQLEAELRPLPVRAASRLCSVFRGKTLPASESTKK